MYGCNFFIFETTPQNIEKRRKTTLLLLLVGCKGALPHGSGRAGGIFCTCGAGGVGALVARCVRVWATARRSPTNVRRAF